MVVLVHFARFGPYHLTRLRAAQQVLVDDKVVGLEIASDDETYEWDIVDASSVEKVTVFPGRTVEGLDQRELEDGVAEMMGQVKPDIVFVAGWGTVDGRAVLSWCKRHRVPWVMMSDTRRADGSRVWWKEWYKKFLLRGTKAALVAGRSQKAYLGELGVAGEKVVFGFDVVDNEFFFSASRRWANESRSRQFLLSSNRFIERKNLERLVLAFSGMRDRDGYGASLDLCLLGDGELWERVVEVCEDKGMRVERCAPWECEEITDPKPIVFLPGFRQIEELPRFYGMAEAFVHPALSEPWGLVVNEAMACGLPVIASANGGAAEELVEPGVTGFLFDPESTESIREGLLQFARLNTAQRTEMGERARELLHERCPTIAFGQGMNKAIRLAGL